MSYPDIQRLRDLKTPLETALGPDLIATEVCRGELTLQVYLADIVRVLSILKDHPKLLLRQLIDICAVDWVGRQPRFDVVYHLLSLEHNIRVRLKIACDGEGPIPTVTPIFPCANWYEREVWDLFGIPFADHPDLRRILTDYNFEGHPLRKDFPLTGHVEVRYDLESREVIYEPVKLMQEYRSFDTLSPWGSPPEDGDSYILPGDEKAQT